MAEYLNKEYLLSKAETVRRVYKNSSLEIQAVPLELIENMYGLDYDYKMDYIMKINFWLTDRFREQIFEHFGIPKEEINFSDATKVMERMYQEQMEKTPDPWYTYGFGRESEMSD